MNLGNVFDEINTADRWSRVDDGLYSRLMNFSFYFVPMVSATPKSNSVAVRNGDLENC